MTGKKSNAFARPTPPARPSALQPPPTRFGAPPVQAKSAKPTGPAPVPPPSTARFAAPTIQAKPSAPKPPARQIVVAAPIVSPRVGVAPTLQAKANHPPRPASTTPMPPTRFAASSVTSKPVGFPPPSPGGSSVAQAKADSRSAKPTFLPPPSAGRPQTIQKMQSLPIHSLKKTEPEFNQLYRNLNTAEAQSYQDFALEIHQEIVKTNSGAMSKTSPSAFSKNIQDKLWQVLENHRGMHVASVPALETGWSDVVKGEVVPGERTVW